MLEVTGLRVFYGGIEAVKGINLHVEQGELVALIGANGAGKTSALLAMARMLGSGVRGSVRFCGKELTRMEPHQLVREGVALVPEGRGVFRRLSIRENLIMGAYSREDHAKIADDLEKVYELLPRLRERDAQLAGTMSGGEQQMLAIGRALMSRPRLLLLDEPSMGLAPAMVQKVFEVIREVSGSGVTILLVEQNAKLALEISNRGYVMESGKLTLTDDSRSLLASARVRIAYLGESESNA